MKRVSVILAAMVGLTGCAAIQRSQAHDTEHLLAAAGFKMQLADTTARQQQLAAMPAYRLLNRAKGDGVEYTYADPTKCKCVYVGGPDEYSAYQRLLEERQIDQDRVWAAQDGMSWGLRPWYWQ